MSAEFFSTAPARVSRSTATTTTPTTTRRSLSLLRVNRFGSGCFRVPTRRDYGIEYHIWLAFLGIGGLNGLYLWAKFRLIPVARVWYPPRIIEAVVLSYILGGPVAGLIPLGWTEGKRAIAGWGILLGIPVLIYGGGYLCWRLNRALVASGIRHH